MISKIIDLVKENRFSVTIRVNSEKMKKIAISFLAFVFCMNHAFAMLAAPITHVILGNCLTIDNFLMEYTFQEDDTHADNGLFDSLVVASAPATITLINDGYGSTGSQSFSGSPGSRIYKVNVDLLGYESFIEWENGLVAQDGLVTQWQEVALSTGERYMETGEDCFSVVITPAGSTYVLEEGVYIAPAFIDPGVSMRFYHCIVVTNDSSIWLSAQQPTHLPSTIDSRQPQIANPTASTVYLNGEETSFEAYNIDGYNYFKLRDLAFVISGTEKQFEVGYDEDTMAITLTSGEPYSVVSGEMTQGDGEYKNAVPTPSTIYLDGEVLDLVVYNINGNNFFKLRDLMQAIDVYVGYDDATMAITLDTSRGYVHESEDSHPPDDIPPERVSNLYITYAGIIVADLSGTIGEAIPLRVRLEPHVELGGDERVTWISSDTTVFEVISDNEQGTAATVTIIGSGTVEFATLSVYYGDILTKCTVRIRR